MTLNVGEQHQVGATDESVVLNGLRFHYRDWGNDSAQPLVCLHGFSSHARTWDTFARAMQGDFHVLALDQRGHGETEWAADYAPERRVEDLHTFVTALRLPPFVLLGLSMGGIAAFMYAAAHPELVERLVIVDIAPEANAVGTARIGASVSGRDVFDDPEEAVSAARVANPRPPDAELRHRVLNNLVQREDGAWTFRYDVALRNGTVPRGPRPPEVAEALWASLAGITSPTLLIRGSDSDVLSRELAERMVASIPDCGFVEVSESGHSVPLDNPAGFVEAARGFLVRGA